jgi:ERCC4-type nuclease
MTEIDNTFYMDDREEKNTQAIASIVYDDMEITHLDIGDVLMRGVVFELKAPDDFVSSVFDSRLFTQISNMTEQYKNSFILVHGTYFGTQLVYDSRSKVHNFPGIVASCIARGIVPIISLGSWHRVSHEE